MNKAALIEHLAEKFDMPKAEVGRMVDALVEAITATLKRGDEVAIPDLGKWKVKDRAARNARNPRTGEVVKVAATRAVKFSVAKSLKDAVKG